jgi:hypothetical protein
MCFAGEEIGEGSFSLGGFRLLSIAYLLSLAISPTLTTKYVYPTATPTTLSIGLNNFLRADRFLSPSPTNNRINILV